MHHKLCLLLFAAGCALSRADAAPLRIAADPETDTITISRTGDSAPIVTQHVRESFRPYLDPIVAPDGQGLLTESSPDHHKHQTGLYWGFTRLNGRDYFHHPGEGYWRRVSATPGPENPDGSVSWRTVYDLLDAEGQTLLTETQEWSLGEADGEYVLDLVWSGKARVDVTISKYDYGGLFLRMPWRPGMPGEVVNAARQRGVRAEGQRATWIDVGLQVEGRNDFAHIALFDHPKNDGYPQPWRVDGQLGVGPARARLGDWQIEKDETKVFRHRLVIYTGDLDDVALTRKWRKFSNASPSVLWGIARKEGYDAAFLSPEEAVRTMTVQDGFAVNMYASEPMITQPMAFCWDDRGRLWIAENRDYESRGKGFANFGDSRILILEDTDRDGTMDTRKVFAEDIPFPAAVAVGFDGLWLGAPPNLLFLPDRDDDDRVDSDAIEIRLTGWGIRDRHETLNSFHWGPDGWLYGCQGFATPSTVGKPVGKGRVFRHKDKFPKNIPVEDPVSIDGGVWKYHPTKDRFEVVAHGFSNPWGIDYDAKGQLFISACVIPHLWHVIPGGIYHRQGGRHFNPYVYSDIRTIADHRHRSAHGGLRVYLSDAFPAAYQGLHFMANIHEHAVLIDVLERRGSGFVARHGEDFAHANNAQWIGFSVEIGPDGAVYVLDWHDADICGVHVRHKHTGRIFRLQAEESRAEDWPGRYGDLAKLSDGELAALQESTSSWHARRSRVILQGRAVKRPIAHEALTRMRTILNGPSEHRLRALWTLHVTGSLSDEDLLDGLRDNDEYVRAWSVQLLCEDKTPSPQALRAFASLARTEESAVVRLYLASALGRLEHEKRWAIATGLVAHKTDTDDHNIPKMLWFAIEPLVVDHPERALELAARSALPLVRRHIARRLGDGGRLDAVVAGLQRHPNLRVSLLRGLRDALDGQAAVPPPTGWPTVYGELRRTTDATVQRLSLELAQKFGDADAARTGLETLQNQKAALADRRRALRTLALQQDTDLPDLIVDLLSDAALRSEAIRATAAFDSERLSDELLERYSTFTPAEKLDAVHALACRSLSGGKLARAIQTQSIPRSDIPPYVARQLRRVVGSGFIEIWGPIDAGAEEKQAEFDKYRGLLTTERLAAAHSERGQAIFQKTCGGCHILFGQGGRIGPELTGANRGDLNYLLGNVLTPSEVIQDAYRMSLVLTNEGRLYSGILAGESERHIELRVVGETEPVTIPKATIASREVAPVSMMPDGLLSELKEADVLDLIKYLQTQK